jgi:hypothetical protein
MAGLIIGSKARGHTTGGYGAYADQLSIAMGNTVRGETPDTIGLSIEHKRISRPRYHGESINVPLVLDVCHWPPEVDCSKVMLTVRHSPKLFSGYSAFDSYKSMRVEL